MILQVQSAARWAFSHEKTVRFLTCLLPPIQSSPSETRRWRLSHSFPIQVRQMNSNLQSMIIPCCQVCRHSFLTPSRPLRVCQIQHHLRWNSLVASEVLFRSLTNSQNETKWQLGEDESRRSFGCLVWMKVFANFTQLSDFLNWYV